jgi:hypothetical protein
MEDDSSERRLQQSEQTAPRRDIDSLANNNYSLDNPHNLTSIGENRYEINLATGESTGSFVHQNQALSSSRQQVIISSSRESSESQQI